jgi:exosortase/archaeosortase family protein
MQTVKRNTNILVRLLPILSFIIPFIILYYTYPSSFEETWKGRTYYLFFIWLVFLETILSWEELETSKISKLRSKRAIGLIIFLLLPTFYVIITNFLGLNSAIAQWYTQYMGPSLSAEEINWFAPLMPLSIEYFVFGVIFISIQVITHGKKGLTNFSISTSLLFAIGTFYIIDNLYPYGRIAPLQYPALPTTTLAANVLSLMGYQTKISIGTDPYYGWMPILSAWDPKNPMKYATFGIGWPCAGVESLLLYTITILLFLKKSNISLKQRVVYFMFGAIVTYFINILRIATIFVIAMNTGVGSLQTQRFHEYYGPLYSIIWIISYPLIMIGSRALWRKIKN